MDRSRCLLAILASIAFLSPLSADEKGSKRAQAVQAHLAALQKLADADLFAKYDTAAVSRWSEDKDELTREEVLIEVIRRGGSAMEKWLRTKMESDYERRIRDKGKLARSEVRRLEDNLAIFTALRRVQKKPDPLTVEVAIPKDAPATTREFPTIGVRVTNTDPEQLPLWFKFGGDGRSGRLERWRFEVLDESGHPVLPYVWRSMYGGGLFHKGPLGAGESWKGALPIGNYVRIREPGEYSIRVFYHNEMTIAELDDVSGLILFESKPFKLKVIKAPRKVIALESGDRDGAKAAFAALPEKGPVRVVVTPNYGPFYHDFIDPKSHLGRLHELAWRAVPTLLDGLRDDQSSLERRAWALGLLYAITGEKELDPFGLESEWQNAVVNYEYRAKPSDGSSSGGKVDAAMQRKLVARWLKLADEYFDVREPK
ncbi:MAG TPA: hypothetical protein VKD71_07725 [Gemmataceae bacterium]|nr:hypothetical protein [Gemmataceae bacterium]